jgi:hypothetical protein
MTCSNPLCKHEFCWICRNNWKLHNTQTGGFFRCNKWVEQEGHEYYDDPPDDTEAVLVALQAATNDDTTYGTAMHATKVSITKSKEVARFLHHYQRWSAHAESAVLEQKMFETVCSRLAPVVNEAKKFDGCPMFNFGGKGLSFVHAAFIELFECRSLLQHSYAFSHYRYKTRGLKYTYLKQRNSEQKAFEQHQSELEVMTEQISDVVARLHLRATQSQIIFLTASAVERRKEFSNFLLGALNKERKDLRKKTPTSPRKNKHNTALRGLFDETTTGNSSSLLNGSLSSIREEPSHISASEERDIDAAIRASTLSNGDLEEIRSSSSDLEGNETSSRDAACDACTYVNFSEARRCAMCGQLRR